MVQPGDLLPSFSLKDQEERLHTLDSIRGSKAVFYFYPKDDTPGCTQEACEFRDLTAQFGEVKVFGVSPDSVKSHVKFAAKHQLPFPLLADEDQSFVSALGLWVEKSMYGKKYMGVERTTLLVDEEGRVTKVWSKVKPAGHAAEVLASL